MTAGEYTLLGWGLSLYTGKARSYLRCKGIPYVEKPIRLWEFGRVKKMTGAAVMPVVITPQGQWLQDTSHIIDSLEPVFPQAPVLPATPRQRIAALVLEAWGDEFWLPTAMHYRWNFAENYALFEAEAGANLIPFAPAFLRARLARAPARLMRSFLPGLGVRPEQVALIERWTTAQLDLLDAHFAAHPYLLGTRPSYGDFGLIGPLYAHLGRDPWPKRELIAPRRHLAAWVARMTEPAQPVAGEFLPGDEVPATLAPVFRGVFGEFWPALEEIQRQVAQALAQGQKIRRSLGEIEYPMAGGSFRRAATPFSLWMAQRPLDAYGALDAAGKSAVDAWLAGVGGERAMQLSIQPRLARRALHVVPVGAAVGAAHGRDPVGAAHDRDPVGAAHGRDPDEP